jgi:hypothetical protein
MSEGNFFQRSSAQTVREPQIADAHSALPTRAKAARSRTL